MITLRIAEIAPRFPAFRVAVVVAENLVVAPERTAELEAEIAGREEACRVRYGDTDLSAIPGIAAWRAAYRGFGIKKTSYRCSVERLVKRVKAGERLPSINAFVDAYNAVSLAHVFCCGADDLDLSRGPFAFRYARPDDSFRDMAGGEEGAAEGGGGEDPPKEGEVVFADARHVLCRRWNWRQDARTAISPATTRALVTVQANGWGDLDAAVADLTDLLARHCGARCRVGFADAGKPEVEV